MATVQSQALFAVFRALASSSHSAEAARDLRDLAEKLSPGAQVNGEGNLSTSDRH